MFRGEGTSQKVGAQNFSFLILKAKKVDAQLHTLRIRFPLNCYILQHYKHEFIISIVIHDLQIPQP